QFLRLRADRRVLEQVAHRRQTPEEWHLIHVGLLIRDDDSADNNRAAVGDQHFRFRSLGIDGRNTLDARNRLVYLVVRHHHVHENGAVGGDLRRDFELQYRIHELNGNRVVHDGLHRDLGTLLDGRFLVVLGNHLRFREQLAYASLLRGGDNEVEGEILGGKRIADAAGGAAHAQVCIQRYRTAGCRSATCADDHRRSRQWREIAGDRACGYPRRD